jgi:hypothetical protein
VIHDDLPVVTHGVLAYDARRLSWVEPRGVRGIPVPPPALAYRTLAALTGAWLLEDTRCRSLRGEHDADCFHGYNDCSYTVRWLARTITTNAGQSQRRGIARVLMSLAMGELNYWTAAGRERRRRDGSEQGPLLTLVADRDHQQPARNVWDQPCGRFSWRDDVKAELLAGHFQRIPIELVRLPGRTAFRTWAQAFLHCPLSRGAGEWAATGPGSYAMEHLGYASLFPAEVRRSLERDAAAGNDAQDRYRLAVLDRRCGGLKLRLASTRRRRDGRRSPTTVETADQAA